MGSLYRRHSVWWLRYSVPDPEHPGRVKVVRRPRHHEERRRTVTREREKVLGRIIPHVFHREDGEPIKSLRKAWETACRAAGIPGRVLHDARRTAVRNLVRSGVPERVAMMLTGHKTRSVFDRYDIVSDGDLREAARKLDEQR